MSSLQKCKTAKPHLREISILSKKKSLKNLVICRNFRTFVPLLKTDISNKKLRLSQRKFFCRPTSKNF